MDAYTHANQMIDANSAITRMVFPPSIYAIVTGPVPAGQPAIPSRVACEEDANATLTGAYDGDLFLFFVQVDA